MEEKIRHRIQCVTGATHVERLAQIQSLWSGYGEVARYRLQGANTNSVVIKRASPPTLQQHPRGWNTDLSHQRKLESYRVEMAWYQRWAQQCTAACRVPVCYGAEELEADSGWLFILEDVDAAGFSIRKSSLSLNELKLCLQWLANFHAHFLHEQPNGLWPVGCYWHLATRPDELTAMDDVKVKKAAAAIDQRLSAAAFKTFVHGDAKLANFCFADDGAAVAAVDFQYVGGGCGMKDVAYLLSSCLDDSECERWEEELLEYYFQQMAAALLSANKIVDMPALEKEWRELYVFAWADFYRFLNGWMPGHWKIHSYTRRLTERALKML